MTGIHVSESRTCMSCGIFSLQYPVVGFGISVNVWFSSDLCLNLDFYLKTIRRNVFFWKCFEQFAFVFFFCSFTSKDAIWIFMMFYQLMQGWILCCIKSNVSESGKMFDLKILCLIGLILTGPPI